MNNFEIMKLLGEAFEGKPSSNLFNYLGETCFYHSDFSGNTFYNVEEIQKSISSVSSSLDEYSYYTFDIFSVSKVAEPSAAEELFKKHDGLNLCEFCIILYQYTRVCPACVVLCLEDANGIIQSILLSRSKEVFDYEFFSSCDEKDSPLDIPATANGNSSSELYIWKQSHKYMNNFLPSQGYEVHSLIFLDDCIGYRCTRNNLDYAIYMYAYGKSRTTQLDGEYCAKLKEHPFSKNCTVLVVYLHTKKFYKDDNICYSVCEYSSWEKSAPSFWTIAKINDMNVLLYYPRKELFDISQEFMFAFNQNNDDVYDSIICSHNPAFKAYDSKGITYNSAVMSALKQLCLKYGDFKLGYILINDVVYCEVFYLENYGYFGFSVNDKDEIISIESFPFSNAIEFIGTDIKEAPQLYSNFPSLYAVEPLPPLSFQRFALKLTFTNGECKKYVLDADNTDCEVVQFNRYVFTDKIWQSAHITEKSEATKGQSVTFKNGYSISAISCYKKSSPYIEPIITDEILFDDGVDRLEAIWSIKANHLHPIDNDAFKCLLSGFAYNHNGISTIISNDGKRLSCDFTYFLELSKNRFQVAFPKSNGFHIINKTGEILTDESYDYIDNYINGYAVASKMDEKYILDEAGNCVLSLGKGKCVNQFSEGLIAVSDTSIDDLELAFYNDGMQAGNWGYIDIKGNTVIPMQYIFASPFKNGYAFVCKGKWESRIWNELNEEEKFWSDEMRWGVIDTEGNEVIPFEYDDIMPLAHNPACYLAYKNRQSYLINQKGEIVSDLLFDEFCDHTDKLIAYYDSYDENTQLMGIFDMELGKILLTPQFTDVEFCHDGNIIVEFKASNGKRYQKVIDQYGNDIINNNYTNIYENNGYYCVHSNPSSYRIIDSHGITLCKIAYDIDFNAFSPDCNRIIFRSNGKKGVVDINGNTIIPPIYDAVYKFGNSLFIVSTDKDGLATLDGKLILPLEYDTITYVDEEHFLCQKSGVSKMMKYRNLNMKK